MAKNLLPVPKFQFLDNSGKTVPGGKVFTYAAGTTNKLATFTDSTGGTPNLNPIILDANGRCDIWITSNTGYKIVFSPASDTDPPANAFWTEDQVTAVDLSVSSGSSLVGFTAAGAGAFTRTVQSKERDIVSAADFKNNDGTQVGTGNADNSTGITAALAAARRVIFPAIYPTTQTITVPNNTYLDGMGKTGGVSYAGTGDAFNNVNGPNSSGFGLVTFDGMNISTSSGANTGAAIELNAGGFAFYTIKGCRLTGTFKFGAILDAAEVVLVSNNVIDNGGVTNGANIWIVNGADRVGAQTTGFSNSITIDGDNQLNISGAGTVNIIDDGGSNHTIIGNNLNGAHTPFTVAGVNGLIFNCNEMENALAGGATGTANVLFTNVGHVSGAAKGAVQGAQVVGNTFGADVSAGVSLTFAGAMHQGVKVYGNWFRNNVGALADVDVTKLSNGLVGPNFHVNSARTVYTGTHNDADGNILLPPQNGFAGTFTEGAYVWGDTRYLHRYFGGIDVKSQSVLGLQIDAQKWQNFIINFVNTAGTIQHSIYASLNSGAAAPYADRVVGETTALANTPTGLDATHGFVSGLGLLSGSNSVIVLNTAAQPAGLEDLEAKIIYYDGNVTRCNVYIGVNTRNINGVNIARPELVIRNDMTGALVNIDTTLLPAGKFINIQVQGFMG